MKGNRIMFGLNWDNATDDTRAIMDKHNSLIADKKEPYKIKDDLIYTNELTLVLYNHKNLKEFKDSCGEIANRNEYQCHYFALVRTETNDNITINVVIPLVFYNYKQEVSSATVSFNMNDVTDKAKELEELARLQAKKAKMLIKNIEPMIPNARVSYKLTFYNNIHKHP